MRKRYAAVLAAAPEWDAQDARNVFRAMSTYYADTRNSDAVAFKLRLAEVAMAKSQGCN